MKGNWFRLAQSRFWLICYSILIGNERGCVRADFSWFAIQFYLEMKGNWPRLAQSRCWLICYQIRIRSERKLASAGSEQILVDLLLNSNRKWRKFAWASQAASQPASHPAVQKYRILTMATSQKLDFDNVSSVLYFFILFAQCISQSIKKYKTLDTSLKSSFWEVAVVNPGRGQKV